MINGDFPFFVFMSSLIFLSLGIYSFRYRSSPGGITFIFSMLLLSFLGVASTNELLADSFSEKVLWRNLQQIPLFVCPILIYTIILQFIGREKNVILRRSIYLTLPVLVYFSLIFTDQWHHLMRITINLTQDGNFTKVMVTSTEISLFFIFYVRAIGLLALITLLLNIKNVSKLNKKQHYILIFSTSIPYLITLFPSPTNPYVNTSIASIPMGILLFYVLFKYKFLEVHPIAKDKIIENMKEGIVVLDQNGLIVEVNPSSKRILNMLNDAKELNIIGESLLSLVDQHAKLYHFIRHNRNEKIEIQIADLYFTVSSISVMFSKHSEGRLLLFSDSTARKKYEQYLIKKAAIDHLTKVYNRQYIQEATVEKISEMNKTGKRLCFLILDIDRFKAINDTYGHNIGDQVLQYFAERVKTLIGERGIVGRIGGEEFAVLLPNMNQQQSFQVAENIRIEVSKLIMQAEEENDEFSFTVSSGIASTTNPHKTFKQLYLQADIALNRSKENGRNQTTIYEQAIMVEGSIN